MAQITKNNPLKSISTNQQFHFHSKTKRGFKMAIPAYLWLKDDGNAAIKGSADVEDREGNIEILSFGHGLHIPTDSNTGKLTSTRMHSPLTFEKEFDASSPSPYRAVSTGQTQKSTEFKWYKINDTGQEVEYFNMYQENVKVVGCTQLGLWV